MKKLFTILSLLAMFAFAGCEQFGGDDNIVGGSYAINGAIQKGPFIQGSTITIQPLNENLKPIGQIYSTLTTNDAGVFEMDGVNSKYAEIIATGYYFDEVEGKISSGVLTLRSIADLKYNSQTNVNLLTTLTYNRIKNLVTNEGKEIAEAQEQAEKELYTALGIPSELQPNVGCGAMNIATNGDGNGLLLAISAVLQNGRTVGELSEYIAKFGTDLADDGAIQQELLQKFCVYGFQSSYYEDNVIPNLEERYNSLGIEYTIPNFVKYLPYLNFKVDGSECVVYFTYDEDFVASNGFNEEIGREEYGIDKLVFDTDVEFLGYEYFGGYGVMYLSAAPTTLNSCYCDALTSITLPDSVISIEDYAFSGLKSLNSVILGNSVVSVGKFAFAGTDLTLITIPDSVTSIGDYAFDGLKSLNSVTLGNGVISIGDGVFGACSSLTSITIPERVTTIGKNVFAQCDCLAEVYCKPTTPPDCRKAYSNESWLGFSDESMPIIYVPNESVDAYNNSAKWRVYADIIVGYDFLLQKPIIPNNQIHYSTIDGNIVQFRGDEDSLFGANIVSNTYSNGKGVIIFDDDVTTIGEMAFFACWSLKSITIPYSVISIDNSAFALCSGLESVTLGNGVTSIGESAFSGCESLANITIPDSVTSIGGCAFLNCTSLTNITIPESVTSIGNSAFSYSSLVSITIPDGVTSIGDGAFRGCSNLASVTIGNGVSLIGHNVFEYCNNLSEFNGKFASNDGRCLIVDGTLHSFASAGLTEYIIPDSVTSIGDYVFSECSNLTSITLGRGVTSIGNNAFFYCSSITSINIPEGVTLIGNEVFFGCSSLTSINIPESVTEIGESAFVTCSNLKEFSGKFASEDGRCLIVDGILNSFAPAGLTEYTIPDSVTSIGEVVFCGFTNLTSVTIPGSITEIGYLAFYNCSSLASVYCKCIHPPRLGSEASVFGRNAAEFKIYVPTESVNAYKSAKYWSKYAADIVGYDF